MHCIADSELGTSMACSQSRGRREKEREGEGGWTDGHCGGALHTADTAHEMGGDFSHFLISAAQKIRCINIHPKTRTRKQGINMRKEGMDIHRALYGWITEETAR